jgi:flavodoxin
MFEVVYCSRTGNTKMIADEIASELKVTAEPVKTKEGLSRGSFVFLGSDCYFTGYSRKLKKFITGNDFSGRKVALFGTSATDHGNELETLNKTVAARGAIVMGKFNCRGRFLGVFNRKHPTQQELILARRFAHDVSQS